MITKEDFNLIDSEVSQSIKEAFDFVKENSIDHDYILFLAEGEFRPELKNASLKFNSYGIDNHVDKYKDESRLKFFINFMRSYYSFGNIKTETTDEESNITIELMIYTHIWESKPFLKQLYRLASLASGKSYEWIVNVPDMSKHKFINEEIKNALHSKHLRLANTISKGYHSSLRNAFAHSEYYLDSRHNNIHLDTYKGGSWDISYLSYKDWTKKFLYAALLSYHFLNMKYQKRKSLPIDFGRKDFLIIHPSSQTKFKTLKIFYDDQLNIFSFYES